MPSLPLFSFYFNGAQLTYWLAHRPKKPKIRLLDDPAFLAWKGAEEMDKYGFEWQKRIWLGLMALVKRIEAERELREKEQRQKADREEKARKEELEKREAEKKRAQSKAISARPAKPKIGVLDDPAFLAWRTAEDTDKHGFERISLEAMAYKERIGANSSLQKQPAVYLASDQPTSWMWPYVTKVESDPLSPRRNSI